MVCHIWSSNYVKDGIENSRGRRTYHIFITQYFSVAIRCVYEVADLLNIRGKKHYGDLRGQS